MTKTYKGRVLRDNLKFQKRVPKKNPELLQFSQLSQVLKVQNECKKKN